jgi:tRNA A-37 threonylcarbamoyl transferase component Bud32
MIGMNESDSGVDLRATENTAIICFPYGMNKQGEYTLAFDESLDLMQDYKPTIPRLIWLLIFIFSVIVAMVGISNVMPTIGETKEAPFYLIFLVGFPALIFNARDIVFNNTSGLLSKLLEIQFNDSGLALISKTQEPIYIYWTKLQEIKLINSKSKDKKQIAVSLTYNLSTESANIPISAIHSLENWLNLAGAIRSRAPHVTIDDTITQTFKITSTDTSFTEIWLDSLTQAPEQNTLLALSQEYLLNKGRYKITRKLGQGGQGQAYLGEDLKNNEEVVIKEYLLPVYQSNQAALNMISQLEAEALTLKKIDHAQIVHFIDYFQQEHKAYLVMKKANGKTLRQWIKTQGLPDSTCICHLLNAMCEVLNYLHSCNPPIIHRDFTPDNLIIDDRNNLILIDFTIAESLGAASGLPPAGKPAYMPPEQFRGETSIPSDIYSLGGTLFFLVTGKDPEALSQPNLRDNTFDKTLIQIISRCRAPNTVDRYQSIQEVSENLKECSQI